MIELLVAASLVTVNFDDGSLHGFTFTNNCSEGYLGWIDDWPFPPHPGQFASTRVCDHEFPFPPHMTITRTDGKPFTLLSFDSPSIALIQSSRGGHFWFGYETNIDWEDGIFDMTQHFQGPVWQGADWIRIGYDEIASHDYAIFDNFHFEVPEPSTLPLLLLGGLGLLAAQRKAKT